MARCQRQARAQARLQDGALAAREVTRARDSLPRVRRLQRMIHTESAGGVVLNGAGQVLVVTQKGTSWSLPKGHVEDGEDALAAARREIHEEAGVTQLEY